MFFRDDIEEIEFRKKKFDIIQFRMLKMFLSNSLNIKICLCILFLFILIYIGLKLYFPEKGSKQWLTGSSKEEDHVRGTDLQV
jgi:hypothetical protein